MKKLNTLIFAALSCGLFATSAQAADFSSRPPCAAMPIQASAEGEQVVYGIKIVKTNEGRKSDVYHATVSGLFGEAIPLAFTRSSDLVSRIGAGSALPAVLDFMNITVLPVSYNQATGALETKIDVEQGGRLNDAQASSYKAQSCMELGAAPSVMLLDSQGDPEKKGGSKVEAFISAQRLVI